MRTLMVLLALMLSGAAFGQTGEKNFIDQNYIEVTGKSEMSITPDNIYIRIIISEKDIKGKDLTAIENSMVAKLQEIGIDTKKDLTIKDFSSNFKNYWIIKSDIVLTKEYQLLIQNARTAGKVFVELQKLGISNISIEKVENSKILEYRKEVKIKAIKAAQEKAKALTNAIGQEIGKAIYIQEIEEAVPVQERIMLQVRGVNSFDSINREEPEVEFEKIKLDYTILIRFELK